MKKLKLSTSAFQKGEVLTRAQLKKVVGGQGSGEDGSGIDGTCTVSTKCYKKVFNPVTNTWVDTENGSVSCTSPVGNCRRTETSVACDGDIVSC